jgi:hypothetical protein
MQTLRKIKWCEPIQKASIFAQRLILSNCTQTRNKNRTALIDNTTNDGYLFIKSHFADKIVHFAEYFCCSQNKPRLFG